ncbi:MAG: hypothetical protein KDN19_16570 [Verrucomicrobiae bacterium]|nr:hypothetical protein [Verrucomicrobiae bacterium]
MKNFFRTLFSNQIGRIRYAAWEWAIIRVGFAFTVWFATWHTWRPWAVDIHDHYDIERANGLPSLIDLSWIGQPIPTFVVAGLTILLLVIYGAGRWMLVTTWLLFLIQAIVGGIHSSPMGSHHATQVVALVLLGQAAWFTWEKLRPKRFADTGLDRSSGAIFWSQQMICAGYMISAVSKWVNSGGGIIPGARWVNQLPNIAVQFEKNRLQAYYDNLQTPVSTETNQWAIDLLLHQPAMMMFFLALGFYIELLAFLTLFNRASALLVGVGLMSLHAFIFTIMNLPFYYFEAVDFLFFVNLPFWIALIAGKRKLLSNDPALTHVGESRSLMQG